MIQRRFLTISAVVVITAFIGMLAPILIVVSLLASIFPGFRYRTPQSCFYLLVRYL